MFDEKYQNNNDAVEHELPVEITTNDELVEMMSKIKLKVPQTTVVDNDKSDRIMMRTARMWAEESSCKRRQVGAVLAKDGRILVNGYNGTITGTDNNCEVECITCPNCDKDILVNDLTIDDSINDIGKIKYKYKCSCNLLLKFTTVGLMSNIKLVTNDFTVHAEQNIIMYCAKRGISTEGTTLYITTSPCKQCAKLIAGTGIDRVVYDEEYKDTSGVDFLKKLKINIHKLG